MRCLWNFGEVNEPSSRAFWDDFDEDSDSERLEISKLDWNWVTGQQNAIKSELFVVIEGPDVTELVTGIISRDSNLICQVLDKKISIYGLSHNTKLICVCEEELGLSGEAVQLLYPWLEIAKNVVTVTLQSKTQYKCENPRDIENDITFIKGLNSKVEGIEQLETPNFIAGISAGAASFRNNKDLLVSSYSVYTDLSALDAVSSKPIIELLMKVGLDSVTKYVPKFKDQSGLYI